MLAVLQQEKYLLKIDHDDELFPNALEEIVSAFTKQ